MDWTLDGKEYKCTDKAPVGCNECDNCSSCCKSTADTIIQDPYDMWLFAANMRIAGGLPVTFEILISEDGPWELTAHDGLILPNIKMVDEGVCPFLNEAGRCSIHKIRSGFCRLFPLGRGYNEDGTISYYVLNEKLGCEKLKGPGTDVLISDWLEYKNIDEYEKYAYCWHELKDQIKDSIAGKAPEVVATTQAKFLETFYVKSYSAKTQEEFWEEFYRRVAAWKNE